MNIAELKQRVWKLAFRYFKPKQFVFRFDEYTEQTLRTKAAIDDTNVVQYRFINQGSNSLIVINGMTIPSVDLGIPIQDVNLKVNDNEIDNTIYKYKFLDAGAGIPVVHRLLVISKVKASNARGKV